MSTVSRSGEASGPAAGAPTGFTFDYDRAFSRNIGWVTRDEQQRLRRARVAVAGLGGVGGAHVLALSRLGIANFHLADFDEFDVHNMNRQVAAFMSTMGRPKIDVVAEMARDINPETQLRLFREGVNDDNLDEFLKDVDVYVDSLDFFVLETRRKVFKRCRELGIPAMTAAPLGMGTAFLYFSPTGMSFEEYFKVDGRPTEDQYARFIAGLSPSMLNRRYLMVPEAVNFKERRGPSTGMACELCAGVMGTNVLKLLLQRGPLRAAPWGLHFDAYRGILKQTWRPGGNAHPLQRLLVSLIKPVLRGR